MEILAQINKSEKNTAVFLDARKNKAYNAIYDKDGYEIKSPNAVFYDDMTEICGNDDYEIITDSSMHKFLEERGINSTDYEASDYPLGEYLYKITLKKLSTGNDYFWAKAKPLYIQPPSITISKKAGV